MMWIAGRVGGDLKWLAAFIGDGEAINLDGPLLEAWLNSYSRFLSRSASFSP